MAKATINRIDRNLARRLKEARKETGLSTRGVCQKMPSRYRVSHSTIASYENGTTVPPMDILGSLADVYNRPVIWFLTQRETLSNFKYRNLESRVTLQDQRRFAALAGKWAEAYIAIEKHLRISRSTLTLDSLEKKSPTDIAKLVRTEYLNLDDSQPVQNTVSALEKFAAWAIEVRADFGVDGASANIGNKNVVILNPSISNDRARMNTAYELAFVVLASQSKLATEIDSEAYNFASAFLIPDSQIKEAFTGKSFIKLIQFKERFGVSLSAMIFRAEQLKVINTTTSRWLRSEMFKRGWKQSEPGYVWRDRAISFEAMLDSAIQSKTLNWEDAERITSVCKEDLKERIAGVFADKFQDENEKQTIIRFASIE